MWIFNNCSTYLNQISFSATGEKQTKVSFSTPIEQKTSVMIDPVGGCFAYDFVPAAKIIVPLSKATARTPKDKE